LFSRFEALVALANLSLLALVNLGTSLSASNFECGSDFDLRPLTFLKGME
jgi:hypothetical protein